MLINNGFTPLKDPAHLEKVKGLPVNLDMACERHGLDLDLMTSLLNHRQMPWKEKKKSLQTTKANDPQTVIPTIGRNIHFGNPITQDHIIGDILKMYPATEKVFRKYYGAACFSCPGQATETIRQSALMHNVDEIQILSDLNNAAGT